MMKNTADVQVLARPTDTPPANGIARNAANDAQKLTYGASWNSSPSAPSGIRSSLVISLMPSASVCSQPNLPPTRVGPEPILNAAGDLALQPDEDQRADGDQVDDQPDVHQGGHQVGQPARNVLRKQLSHGRSDPG